MQNQLDGLSARRRSERVSIAFPLEASGIDRHGTYFQLKSKTTTVSRYGCCVSVPRMLLPKQQISVRRPGSDIQRTGHVVAQMGAHSDGYLYGIAIGEPCEDMWGIRFAFSFHERLLDSTYDGIYFVNRERQVTYWNEGAEKLTGFKANDAVGKHCFHNLLGHVDAAGNPMCTGACPLSLAMENGQPTESEFYLHHKAGHRVPISVRVLPMRNGSGAIVGAVEVFNDVTAKERAVNRARELENLAFCDSLTGLHNRRYLELKVAQAIEDHQQFERHYGLLLVDLDRFKQVNDNFGHETGDALLRAVALTLTHSVRPADIVGRWGGEEFLALVPDVTPVSLGDLAERCRVMIAQSSINHGESRVSVTASIGVTPLNHADSPETAIDRADRLMYESKASGGDRTTAG